MPRYSSLRSLWTAARSGIVVSLLVCAGSLTTSAFAQMDYAAMDAEKMAGVQSGPMGPNGAQQSASLTNLNSGVKKADSAKILAGLQALLYSDVSGVIRANLTKIDYEGLSAFVDELTEKAGGSVESRDEYQVNLRESQKKEVKESFKLFASTLQNVFVQKLFQKKIDEVFLITYENNSGTGCMILAVPIDGLSEEDQNTALDAVNSAFAPIAIFKRYGFVIAVISHDKQVNADVESITERYQAKLLDEQQGPAYGAYTASGSNNSNAYGMGSGMNSRQTANTASADLLAYRNEVEKALKEARSASRQQVLPFVRSRFSKPASADDAKDFIEALQQSDGVALVLAARNFGKLLGFEGANADESISAPFAAMGSSKSNASEDSAVASIVDSLKSDSVAKAATKMVSASVSLVGSPKLVVIATFDDDDSAQTFADAVQGAITLAKPMLQDSLNKKLEELETAETVDLSPLVDSVCDGVKPQVKGSKVAMVLDLEVLRANAELIRPLLGGKEAKSAEDKENESIDWSVADENATKPADDSFANGDADDAAEATDDTDSSDDSDADDDSSSSDDASGSDDSDDDPFGSDSDDNPF